MLSTQISRDSLWGQALSHQLPLENFELEMTGIEQALCSNHCAVLLVTSEAALYGVTLPNTVYS